jgi:hypothetical protein
MFSSLLKVNLCEMHILDLSLLTYFVRWYRQADVDGFVAGGHIMSQSFYITIVKYLCLVTRQQGRVII